MTITLRPDSEEKKLIEYAKEVTGHSTATKAIFSIIEDHQELSAKLDRTERSERKYQTRTSNAERVIRDMKTSLGNLLQYGES